MTNKVICLKPNICIRVKCTFKNFAPISSQSLNQQIQIFEKKEKKKDKLLTIKLTCLHTKQI
jgi:hypothetical protein